MSSLLYYPGCSIEGSARAYGDSVKSTCDALGIALDEIDDWNCCGATEYFTLSPMRGYALVSRNLALAQRQANGSRTVVAPCSACYLNLAKTDHYLRGDRRLNAAVNDALAAGGLHYTPGAVQIRHLVEVITTEVGIEAVAAKVVRPLRGLRVAGYLGCLVSRPDYNGRWNLREHPLELDELLAALGAEVVDFPARTDCCGGHMTQISPETGLELVRRLVDSADRLGADMLVTVCPMCQMNVDAYQSEMNRHFGTSYHMPILFFTQLMGLAFGEEPERLGLGREIVSARRALAKIGVELPAVAPASEEEAADRPRRPKRGPGLPMPSMPPQPPTSGASRPSQAPEASRASQDGEPEP